MVETETGRAEKRRPTVFAESLRDRRPDFPFLEGRVELNDPELETGSVGRGRLVLLNTGTGVIDLHTDSFVRATVVYTSNLETAATFNGFTLGTGLRVHLNPGEEATIALIFATTTLRDGEKVALPPGDYLVRVKLPILERRPDADGYERSYLAMPVEPLRLRETS
jgi:hypothetical protein